MVTAWAFGADDLGALAARLDAFSELALHQTLLAEFIVKVMSYRKKDAEAPLVEIV